ncbi:MAG: GAF domain-containing protein [Phycisphaerae bacterium]|nr:GAF domain-containing protein [Phycisphaerae bacterium]
MSPRRTSLRWALPFTTLAPIVVAVLVLGAVGVVAARWIVEDHASRVVAKSLSEARAHVDCVLAEVDWHHRALEAALRRVPLEANAIEATMLDFVDAFRLSGHLSSVGVGTVADGVYCILQRRPDGTVRIGTQWRAADGTMRHREAIADASGVGPFRELPWDGYDPRTRPHFRKAADGGTRTWTECYPFWNGGKPGAEMGVSCASPIRRDGALVGVVDTDLTVRGLQSFLEELDEDVDATVFVTETAADGRSQVLARRGLGADVAISALQAGSADAEGRIAATRLLADGEAYVGSLAPIDSPLAPRWSLGILVPERTLTAPFRATLTSMLLVGVVVMAIALFLSMRLSNRVTRPLAALTGRLSDESDSPAQPSDLAEAAELSEAYERMRRRVADRQDELERTNETLSMEIAQRRLAEDLLRQREARLAAVTRALIGLAHNRVLLTGELDDAMPEAARIGAEMLDVARLSIWFYDDAGTSIRCAELYERATGAHSSGVVLSAKDHPDYFRALEGERLVAAHDARSDPRTRSFAADYLDILGITSLLDASLRRGERLLGVVCFEHIGPRRTWSTEDLLFADGFADLLMVAIESHERRRVERELRDLNATLEGRVRDRTRDLAAANERLAELDRLKTQFLATTSHELRTPLNSIIGFTSIVKSGLAGTVNDEQRRQLDIVHTSARHLLGLINDLLDLSRIESGRMTVMWERIAPAEVIDEVSRSLSPLVDAKRLTWDVTIDDRDTIIETDRKKLLQVLLNLGGNAVKFTEKGSIRIYACVHRPPSGPPTYRVTVADSGIGIPAEHMPLLFRPFAQLDASARRALEGTGLGLYLSKQLLGLLGGTITASSEPGCGSTFQVTLPLSRPERRTNES